MSGAHFVVCAIVSGLAYSENFPRKQLRDEFFFQKTLANTQKALDKSLLLWYNKGLLREIIGYPAYRLPLPQVHLTSRRGNGLGR